MRKPTVSRCAALLGAGAILVGAPAIASAQPTGSLDPNTLAQGALLSSVAAQSAGNAAGGSLASIGLGDLGSSVAGGRCAASDPALGPISAAPLNVKMATKESESGIARAEIMGGSYFADTSGVLKWKNETTGASGEEEFGPMTATSSIAYVDIATGAGRVTWTLEAKQESPALSVAIPLALVGSAGMAPSSSAPYTGCSGSAEIA